MMHSYTCFLSGVCLKNGEGKWTVLSCPHHAKWTIALSGKATCKDPTKLYLLAALAALDDLTVRCNVTLIVDNVSVLGVLEEIAGGLESEDSVKPVSRYALVKQFDRHKVTVAHVPLTADKRWREVLANLRAV